MMANKLLIAVIGHTGWAPGEGIFGILSAFLTAEFTL